MGLFDIFKKKPKVAPVVVETLYPANWDEATQSVIVPAAAPEPETADQIPAQSTGETFADETEIDTNENIVSSDGDGEQGFAGSDADTAPEQDVEAEEVTSTEATSAVVAEATVVDAPEVVAAPEPAVTVTPAAPEAVVAPEPAEPVVEESAPEQAAVATPESTEAPEATVAEPTEQERYDAGLEKTRKSFGERLNSFFARFRSVDEDFFEDLEDTLIQADVGYETAMQIADELRSEVKLKNAKNKNDIKQVIIDKLISIYDEAGNGEDISMHFAKEGPTVILFVGVNGVGKTTTIGKMAALYKSQGKKVLLAAADTFRAGATQQLQEWGRRDGVEVVAGPDRADPASVVFDGVQTAVRENYDVLFVDTAGRLQNNVNLMQELEKMKRIITREIPDAPHEVLIVLDGTTGQNALQQAKLFKDSTDVSGIVLTKLDGTAKGGIVLAIRNEMHLPVKWVGLGEQAADLRPFSPADFVQGLFKGLVD